MTTNSRIVKTAACLIALALFALAIGPAATAQTVRYYAVGEDTSEVANGGYKAVVADWVISDIDTNDYGDPHCTDRLVWQAIWAVDDRPGNGWVEMGVVHWCGDAEQTPRRVWVAAGAYGNDGTTITDFEFLTSVPAPTDGLKHRYAIKFSETHQEWRFFLDGVRIGQHPKAVGNNNGIGSAALRAVVGMERTVSGLPSIPYTEFTRLRHKNGVGEWDKWRGRDSSIIGTPMCGEFVWQAKWAAWGCPDNGGPFFSQSAEMDARSDALAQLVQSD